MDYVALEEVEEDGFITVYPDNIVRFPKKKEEEDVE